MAVNKKHENRRNSPDKKHRSNKDKFEWKKASKTLSFWILIILGSIVISQLYSGRHQREADIPYTEYIGLLENGQIQSAEIIENEFHGALGANSLFELPGGGDRFRTILPYIDKEMLESWDKHGVNYQFKNKTTNWMGYLLTSILPWVVLIGIWILVMRRMQGGGSRNIFSFGKSRAKLLTENRPKLTFSDVAGADEAKAELQEIIGFLKDPKKFQKLGGRLPRGALLLGAPGTGKTLLAKAVSGEAEVPFFSMSGADFVEMFVGVGASRVRDLFEQGKKNAPCIIFIDEIDAVGRHRGAGLGGGHDEREQTLNQLLVEMDGFDSNEGVILIAATNRPDVLDPALLRPGRFDRQIIVDLPDVRGRIGILKVHTKKIPLKKDVVLEIISKGTPGMSGADLANLVNEAALIGSRRGASAVSMQDFEEAKDKVMMGVERKSLLISDVEKKNTAIHEAGHVLVSKLVPGSDPVHKVTIIPRGRSLGLTHFLPIDEKHNYSKSFLEITLTNLLGGRVAEKVVMKEYTTGAGNDIERATELARKMVCEWGMSEKLGPLTYGAKEEEIFLGREITRRRNFSDATAVEIDREIKKIVATAEQKAEKLIRDNIDKLHALSNALLEREILDGHEIDLIIQGKKLPPMRKRAIKKKPRKVKSRSKTPIESSSQKTKPVKTPLVKITAAKQDSTASKAAARPRRRKRPSAELERDTETSTTPTSKDIRTDTKREIIKKAFTDAFVEAEKTTDKSEPSRSESTSPSPPKRKSKTFKIPKSENTTIKDNIIGDLKSKTDKKDSSADSTGFQLSPQEQKKASTHPQKKLGEIKEKVKPEHADSGFPDNRKMNETSKILKKARQTYVPIKPRPTFDDKNPPKPAVFETPSWLKDKEEEINKIKREPKQAQSETMQPKTEEEIPDRDKPELKRNIE